MAPSSSHSEPNNTIAAAITTYSVRHIQRGQPRRDHDGSFSQNLLNQVSNAHAVHIRYAIAHQAIGHRGIKPLQRLVQRALTLNSQGLDDTGELHSKQIAIRSHTFSLPMYFNVANAAAVRKQTCRFGSSYRSLSIVCSRVAKPSKNASSVSKILSLATPPITISQSV